MAKPQQKKGGSYKSSSSNNNNKKNGKGKQPYRKNKDINDVFEADDDQRQLQRKGHDLDEVDNYEYQVGDIQGDDDEEIDSDEAFDESDDDRFDHFKFSGSTKPSDKKHLKKKSANKDIEINLDESEHSDNDDDDESDMDGDDYMDIADMLDDDESPAAAVVDKESVRTLLPDEDEDDDDLEAEEFMGFSDNDDESDDDDGEDNDQDVVDFITSLDTKKRKRGVDKNGVKKHKPFAERSEIYQENEFNLAVQQPSKRGDQKKKLDLKDLMGSMDGEASMGGLRDAVKSMSDSTAKQATLSAPLAQRVQDRMERQAAYKEARKEVSRWDDTVKENREADHLSFPMQQSVTDHRPTSATLASKFVAETDMEKQIQQALADAGMKDEELEAFEALKLNKLSVDEVEARRKELGMMRELMFRHEMKAKRMKKIKSKSYRKLKRQEKARLDEQISKLQELDHEISHEDQEEAALSRAEERMSLKHKNTGKWAKRALARGQLDEGTRDAIMEQLQRGEQLRRKIQGQDSDDDGDDGSDYDSGDATDDKTRVAMELDALENDLNKNDEPKKGIFAMKFMQDAAKRQQQANKDELDQFRNEWLDENSDNDEKDAVEPAYSHVANNPGRITYGAKKDANSKTQLETPKDETTTVTVKVNDAGQIDKISHSAGHTTRTSGSVKTSTSSPLADLDSLDANPWLQNDTSRLAKKASKSNKATKGKKIQPKEDEEEDVELDTTNILSVKSTQPTESSNNKKKNKKNNKEQHDNNTTLTTTDSATVSTNHVASDDENDDNVPAPTMVATSNKLAFNQRELVARAFANDDVLEEFEEEKAAVIAEDDDKVEDLTLPGWGSWSGSGVKNKNKNKNKKNFTKVTKGISADKRKDAKLASVIINEKRHKKSEKYQASQVPFPFKSMEQYEHSLRAPVGQEWNTRASYQNMTKPRVMTKLGTVIDPLSAPFK